MSTVLTMAVIKAVIPFIAFRGIHAKMIDGNLNPYQDEGQKHIEFLTDSDTVIFALSEAGELFLIGDGHFSFNEYWATGFRFTFAFSMPKEFWEEQVRVKSDFYRMATGENASPAP